MILSFQRDEDVEEIIDVAESVRGGRIKRGKGKKRKRANNTSDAIFLAVQQG